MLTDKEMEKLKNRDPATYKANDFIVRRKFKKWLDDIEYIEFILNHLPERQLKKIFADNIISDLFNLTKITLSVIGIPKIMNGDFVGATPPRQATAGELDRVKSLKKSIFDLCSLLSGEDAKEVINQIILDRGDQYRLIDKNGYKTIMDIRENELREMKRAFAQIGMRVPDKWGEPPFEDYGTEEEIRLKAIETAIRLGDMDPSSDQISELRETVAKQKRTGRRH